RSNGNHAEFEVNGQVLDIPVGRGVNVVVVALDGSVASSAGFDTHGAGSEALEAFVAQLAPGKLVLMGVKDDAWANMSLAAKDAIAACGGELIRNLTYRGSYALIGIKGGEALDEQTFADGQVAIAAATFDTIKSYNITVTSTSRSNGNRAIFMLDGSELAVLDRRGLNVVTLTSAGLFDAFQNFDTFASGSDDLVSFLQGLENGTVVLIGARDDASNNISSAAQAAVRSCGATLIESLSYRGSYALIGVKGGAALAEQAFVDGGPIATATAIYEVDLAAIAASTSNHSVTTSITVAYNSAPTTTPQDTILNITVTSTGRSNGNRAIFMLDGSELAVLDRRGLNVATLTSAGLFDTFQNFDTFASGSDDLVSFLQGLEDGTVVLIGARDDASNNISSAAQAAVRSCGATLIESLSYRGSYALIGIKGGAALAEQAFLDGGPVAVATAIYAIYLSQTASTSTTSTLPTTTTVPFCTMLTCPPGFVQIGGNGTTLRGADVSTCCSEAEEGMAEVGVRSAGFSDGNEATFVANGREIFRAPQRGLTLVTLRPDATRLDAETFDTMATDSEALAAFVGSLANGTLVLVGASDEASLNLTASAKAALRTLGARLIEGLGFRAGYALVGVKGASALAEDLSPMGAGYAVAFASIQVQIPLDARPLCDPMDPDLPVAGHASLGNLRLDAGCRYQLFEGADAQRCLAGTWLVISGSSNALLGFQGLLSFLAPQEYEIERSNERVGSSMVADVVVENGRVVHWASLSSQVPACWQQNLHLARENWKACKLATQELLLRAPAYSSTAVRVTVLVSLFWYRTELALEVLREDLGWGVEAQVALIVQVGSWYSVCAVSTECPRQELLGLDTVQVFEREMSQAFRALEPFCESRRCFVQTLSWTNLHRDQANFQRMNAHIQEASAARAGGLRLIDVYGLGRSMPEEVINGHGSQQLNLWVWTVTLNALCPFYQPLPDSRIAGASHFARWEGLSCSAAQARWENCPGYYPACLHTRCEMWECMHAVPCTLRAAVPPSFDASGATFAAFGAGAVCGERLNVSRLASPAEELWVCHRLWCRPRAAAPLAIAALLSALVLGACVRAKRQATEETKAQKEERSGAKEEDLPMDTHVPTEMPEVPLEMPEKRKKKTVVWRESGPWPSPEQVISLQIEQPRHEESRAELDFGPPVEVEFLERSTAPCESPKDQHQALRAAFPAAARPTPQCPELTDLFFNVASKTTSLENQSRQRSTASLAKCPAYMAPPERFALGLARVLAATHVLLGNLVASNDRDVTAAFGEQFAYFCGWGFTWAPWFFMVSGFVLFSSELKDPKEENILQYVLRRSTGIYPLYAILLVPSFLIATTFNSASDWQTLVAQCFLVQAWIPSLTERCLQMHCWFLSCMLAFWFLFVPLACVFRSISLLATSLLMGLCFCLPWLTILIPLALMEPLDWHQSPELGEVSVMLKYHPACYLHVFVLGMLLARLRQHLARGAGGMGLRSPWAALQLAAPAGYLGLMAVFCIQELQAPGSYELLAPSCVLPFQAMVVLGLAGVPSLPLPFFAFACSRLDFLEPYAYALYLCQGLCFQVWPFGPERFGLGWFLVFNFSVSYLVATLVQMPAQRWWASRGWAVKCLVPCLLAAAMLGFSSLPDAIRET
ncbi:unnamed protein product, partial [Effrenium voratum]